MAHVIKRRGDRQAEAFSSEKLNASIQAACLSVRSPEGEAKLVADHVSEVVANWVANKPSVTSNDIRHLASRTLEAFHPEAAYLYQNHQLVL